MELQDFTKNAGDFAEVGRELYGDELLLNNIIANKYIVQQEIGRGKFGIVYKGEHVKHRTRVAIKMESNKSPYNTIKYEATILNYLYHNGCRAIPSVLWYGIHKDYKCLTMNYYDQTIEQYLKSVMTKCASSPIYYLKQVIKLVVNMVAILGQIHNHQIIHRDIKPENFMIANGELHLIDFGIASSVSNLEEINTEPNRDTIIGSPKYISYFIHQGYEPMYRDDLISVGYCFLYFVMGSLPWSNIVISENNTQQVYQEIHILHEKNQLRKKQKGWANIENIFNKLMKKYVIDNTPKYANIDEHPEALLSGNNKKINDNAQVFANIFEYFTLCYSLQLDEKPFYEELCEVLQKNL
uniref:non-specific serine/threonine protein kinase n=1 Tax=viral metagenome TaxID=1070528 RepID=A0A6C0JZ31_9ZZZZ